MRLKEILNEIENPPTPMKLVKDVKISENLKYHLDRNLSLEENVFRNYSESYFNLIKEVRDLYNQDLIELSDEDVDIVESNLGETAIYEGRENRPFRTPGGPKKFAVYVKSKSGKIKKVTFGDPKMRIRASSAARRKSFRARHKCSQKKDRTTAGYWSCRSHRIRSLGTKSKGKYW